MQAVDLVIAAVLDGDEERVAEYVHGDPSIGLTRNMFGASPLHAAHYTGRDDLLAPIVPDGGVDFTLAAELGRIEVVREQLTARPELARSFDESGSTALHGACYWGQLEVAETLLAAGADATAATRDAFLTIAPLGAAVATTPGIPQPSDDEDVVLALARLLLDHGAEPNHRRKDGMTALHTAAWRGMERTVEVLLDSGADPSLPALAGAHDGETPADTAVSQGHFVLAAAIDSRAKG
jgi:ankyrin repeat protein